MAKKKKKQQKRSPLRTLGRGLYWTLVVLSAIIVGAWGFFKFSAQKPTFENADPPPRPTTGAAVSGGQTVEDTDPTFLQRKKDTWVFLLAAEDQISGNTDTIMVCTYDTVNQKIGLVSIPRDTLVDREGWKYHKINAAYFNGNFYEPPDGGSRELKAAVSEVLGIPIDHYILIDTKIFVAIVDAVGGVDFNVPVHMAYDDPTQDLHIHYEPGMQHLSGQQALEVVRCRQNSDGRAPYYIYDAYPDADIGRTRTQQEMVKTIVKKVLSQPQKVPEYVQIFCQYVKTDLKLENFLWLAGPALKFDFDNLTTATLPGDGSARYGEARDVYELDIEGSLAIINDCLNPYTTDVTEEMVRMVRGE